MQQLIKFSAVVLVSCQAMVGQGLSIPENYTLVDSIRGDLNRDGIDELAVAYTTAVENEETLESVPRELIIYQKEGNAWVVWKKSAKALYGSRDGGMMGDPFGGIEIKKGLLLVNQNGGSSWKWGHTDTYRYQEGAFYLIGYSSNYGKPCEYWTDVDFNLSTGKMIVEKEYESCGVDDEQQTYKRENETIYKKGLRITLENRNQKELKIVTPKYKHEIYIATGNE